MGIKNKIEHFIDFLLNKPLLVKLIIKLRDIQSIVKNHIHIHYWIKHFAFILKLYKELLEQSKLQDSSQLTVNLLRPSFVIFKPTPRTASCLSDCDV